jgi:alkanesulfonate monooxygenase SsuD/methylene tetrahydromethanopterin reductase-like flavin-dependent oxidoreductase (luciferase family)
MNLTWVTGSISDTVRAGIEARRRPGFDPNTTIGVGPRGLAERIEAFVEAGFSKFVIRPAEPPDSWAAAVEAMAPVLARQR